MSNFNNCIERQNKIDSVVNKVNDNSIIAKNLLIKERIINPAHYVVMLGETSTGKSALINSVLNNNKTLIENAKPTTGVITEVVISNKSEDAYLAINKDSSLEELEKETFDELVVKPDDNLHRLRYIGKSKDNKYEGMRLFDTPGYGSLISYHEEVLKEFIPESDVVVYVVSYKSGLSDDDYQFLKYVGEIINDNVEVVLAINMCPPQLNSDNKRIKEIHEAVNDCIHKEVKVFLVESNKEKNLNTKELWDYIYRSVNSEEKIEELSKTLYSCQNYILDECKIRVTSQIAKIESKEADLEEKLNLDREFLNNRKEILKLIEETFTKIADKSLTLITKSSEKIKKETYGFIDNSDKWSKKEETFAYMQSYHIPKLVERETENLMNYTEDEINQLDQKIENILNTAIKNLQTKVSIEIPVYAEVIESIVKKHVGDGIKQGLREMFITVGGNGGVGAGVANAASKGLKSFGNLFGKTFSRETHNSLKHFLKVIKATSIKGISAYLAVFTEGIFYLYDALTWQGKLKDRTDEAISGWKNDIEKSVSKEVMNLKEVNDDEINDLFDDFVKSFNKEEDELDSVEIDELIKLKLEILELYKF
ncbi:dynamin family protein [Clostridium beijerinckii]|uniref:GTPase n=1 Tax=Clostridium beijerinckii TaxID=1520 RepID=A0A9Q5CQ36_CLOBE|nr:dynamin family protein [Clostridium beijerinckii]AQS05948.1 GTPase Der [Clostridium beijerinckii]MBA2888144.1 putative GTPase [Clostridium beijerinckii]MBA2902836.1 putative GTPase [Clostridium beijerinckii]MBA2912662.1 putative GTPase [Clostridium beijerinckii]MBA9014449.1 putative GTPase [Clostridium beijerinckii]